MKGRLVIVGSGIAGLAHAVAARAAGWSVRVLERTARPIGASVRNFGTIWPIGQEPGVLRQRALRSVDVWRALSQAAGFACRSCGSQHLAYHDDAWRVLQEFEASQPEAEDAVTLLGPEEVAAVSPAVRQEELRGGLWSSTELGVVPGEAVTALIGWLERQDVAFHFTRPAVKVHAEAVETSDGARYPFDRLLVCSGDELQLLFPEALRAARVVRSKLQMMRTVAQPGAWRLEPIVASELTLRHYPSFRACPSVDALKARIARQLPAYDHWGIHVLAVQHPAGDLVLGDSHEYGYDFDPGCRDEVDALVLAYLQTFLDVPDLRIRHRWAGTYLKSTNGRSELVLEPQEHVQVVTALGGAGMTLSFALAEEVVAAWS